MKMYLTISVAMLTGAAIGGFAVQGLHAQAKPPVYSISEIVVSNPEGYQKEYTAPALASIKASGGSVIAGGPPRALVGDAPPARIVVIKWDNDEQITAWQNSEAYKKAREIGDKFAKWRAMYSVTGIAQ